MKCKLITAFTFILVLTGCRSSVDVNEIIKISTVSDLESLREREYDVALRYKLMNDLDLGGQEWEPIGDMAKPFWGIFDGQDFTISNLKITTYRQRNGLFGYNIGHIRNLKLANVNIDITLHESQTTTIGALAAETTDIISNIQMLSGSIRVTLAEDATTDAKATIGGIIGFSNFGGTLDTSSNNMDISGEQSTIGGLVGADNGGLIITNGKNEGSIEGKDVGGLVGQSLGTITINNSQNLGVVNSTANNIETCAGGLVGRASILSMTKSLNTGQVSNTEGQATGGLIGKADAVSIATSYNEGLIDGTLNVGGLVGIALEQTAVLNSYNRGSITGSANVGGIIGMATLETAIDKVYNAGLITGGDFVGGLLGKCSSELVISNSINFTNVLTTTDSSNIGNLVGGSTSNAVVTNSYYLGATLFQTEPTTGTAFGEFIEDAQNMNTSYFVSTMTWDYTIWSFNGLNISGGIYPTII